MARVELLQIDRNAMADGPRAVARRVQHTVKYLLDQLNPGSAEWAAVVDEIEQMVAFLSDTAKAQD